MDIHAGCKPDSGGHFSPIVDVLWFLYWHDTRWHGDSLPTTQQHPATNSSSRRKVPSLTRENRMQFVSACRHPSTFDMVITIRQHPMTIDNACQLSATTATFEWCHDSTKWLSNTTRERDGDHGLLYCENQRKFLIPATHLPSHSGTARRARHDNNKQLIGIW